MEKATFGAGCFWGVEDAYRQLPGVISTRVGYAGGHRPDPTYHEVCMGMSGHTEVVEVLFDPDVVSYQQLLDLFHTLHDPTLPLKTQYRSMIFTHSPEQQMQAEAAILRWNASGAHPRPVVTVIQPAGPFYCAEEYHQQYYEKTGRRSCHAF